MLINHPFILDQSTFIFLVYLSSFERLSGDDGKVVPPVPIPNTAVKHFYADDSPFGPK